MALIERGKEPENIKKRLDTLFAKLDSAYPDKVIRGLQKDHRKWAETVTELYRLLGYPDNQSFLEAYGYTVARAESGRPKTLNPDEIIAELRKRYPNGMPFSKISEITKENPDLKGVLKTMQNNANELFGMGLKDYFNQIGLFGLGDKKSQIEDLTAKLKQRYPAGAPLPKNVAALKEENQDLPMNRLVFIKEVYGMNPKEYLEKQGLIHIDTQEKAAVLSEEQYLALLKQRYADRVALPVNVTALIEENPDIPIRKLNKYLRDKGEKKADHYYIRNKILQGGPTDREEFTFFQVRFLHSGSVYWALSEIDHLCPGDIVSVECGETSEAMVLQIHPCLGIDAPYPVSSCFYRIKKRITRNQNILKIGKNPPLAAISQMTESPCPPPMAHAPKKHTAVIDLADTDRWNQPRYELVQLRFRGLLSEIRKLWEYLDSHEYSSYLCTAVNNRIAELVMEITDPALGCDECLHIIQQFPSVKVTGLVEDFGLQRVVAIYSESGADCINKTQLCAGFDGKDDGADGRWAHNMDMMKKYRGTYYDTRTGLEVRVNYAFPWKCEWDGEVYV